VTWGFTFLIAVGLAMDAFSVALGVGASLPRLTPRHMFRLSWHFGLFQFMMPVLGWAAGSKLVGQISSWSHWLAFLLLTLIGARMMVDGLRTSDSPTAKTDPTRGVSLVTLSLATSFDALAVGLSLAAIGVAILYPSILTLM